ncbi:MAG: hypothetical protein MUF42_12615 [Cytophagaceae bacterium]|jgi:hypothetical protein|nr:hypothetical protein [Cytophagaceae bacterium]
MDSQAFRFYYNDPAENKKQQITIFWNDVCNIYPTEYLEGHQADPNSKTVYVIAIYTKSGLLMGKKSNTLVLRFESEKERDALHEAMINSISVINFEVKFFPV